jgi:hypothetical protein
MLHPKEDKAARQLKKECRNCNREDIAESYLVHVNDMRPEGALSEAGADTITDPTLPRAQGTECLSCGHNEAVFFQVCRWPCAAARGRRRAWIPAGGFRMTEPALGPPRVGACAFFPTGASPPCRRRP